MRIVEFPRYFAVRAVFPDDRPVLGGDRLHHAACATEDNDLDMPFFVTAHEVAHQWWGHQVVGANAQGSPDDVGVDGGVSALMVMEKRYGQQHVSKFSRHELDRYLTGRAARRKKEQPLIRVENQAYIHYHKGSLALYALRDYIGEDAR